MVEKTQYQRTNDLEVRPGQTAKLILRLSTITKDTVLYTPNIMGLVYEGRMI